MTSSQTKYLSDELLGLIVKGDSSTPPSGLYLALFKESPDREGVGGVEITGTGYSRVEIRSKLTWNVSGFFENTEEILIVIESNDWDIINGVGIFDAENGGNLLAYTQTPKKENTTSLRWKPKALTFSYKLYPLVVNDWDDRPKEDIFEGFQIIYAPTGVKYVYSENVKDFIRYQYWKMFIYDTQAELSGNYLPLDEPDYPWDFYTGDPDAWSIANDGTYDWVRLNSLPYPSGTASSYYVNKALPTNFKGSYFNQGWIHVPTKSAQTSSNTAAMNIFGARPDGNRASYTFSASSGTHQNRISHVSIATPDGTYFYLSPETTSPVWFEIYFIQNKNDNSKFKSLIYINHAVEPNMYYDETYPAVEAPSASARVSYGDLGADNVDMRTREFKFGNLWYRGEEN